MAGYWESVARQRASRRRMLAGFGSAGLGVAALSVIGCGGGDEKAKDHSGLLTEPQDTSAKAKLGGTLKGVQTGETLSFDVNSTGAQSPTVAMYTYPRVLKYKPAKWPNFASDEIEGDFAESYELSADKLQLTVKVRQGLKWDRRAPTNSRDIDVQDVLTSWKRFADVGLQRLDYVYSNENPLAPIEPVSAPDSRTVVFKLHQPFSGILELFVTRQALYVMPRESDGGFDPRFETRGYGPWLLENYTPSIGYSWRKNPDYYVKDRPFADRVEEPIVPEYATRLAQQKTGNIYFNQAKQEDILQTKQDVPELVLYRQGVWSTDAGSGVMHPGYKPGSPFVDERVRQAFSMLLERDIFVDIFANRESFAAAGLDTPSRLNSNDIVSGEWDGYWLDPLDKGTFGPNAKFFEHNIAESKKLLAAAGFPNGFETTLFIAGGSSLSPLLPKKAELVVGMIAEAGIKAAIEKVGYPEPWLQDFYYGETADYNGVMGPLAGSARYAAIAPSLFTVYHSKGSLFRGMSVDGRNPQNGDAQVNSAIEKIQVEFDKSKQQAMVKDLVRYMAGRSYFIQIGFTSLPFELVWPAVRNYGLYRPRLTIPEIDWWIDETQAPLKKA